MTLTDKDTIGAELLRDDAAVMGGLLGGLTAACRVDDEREAQRVCRAWLAALEREYGKDPTGRVSLPQYRRLFELFAQHVQNLLTREGLTR